MVSLHHHISLQVSAISVVGIIGSSWLDKVVGIGTLVIGVCGFSFEDVSARVIALILNFNTNIIILVELILIVGENKQNLHTSRISISSYGNVM